MEPGDLIYMPRGTIHQVDHQLYFCSVTDPDPFLFVLPFGQIRLANISHYGIFTKTIQFQFSK